MTAAEALAILQSDAEWVRQSKEREEKHNAQVARIQAETESEEKPLLAELATIGIKLDSVWDLVNTDQHYPQAIPVLLKHLPLVHHPIMREGIARSLTVREARGSAGPLIIQELADEKDLPGSEARWALAHALTVVADRNSIPAIKQLLADIRYADIHDRLQATLKRLRVTG